MQLSPSVAARLMREVRTPDTPQNALSPRENEVLRLLAAGCSNKEMARELDVGEKTIKTHVSRILGKLGVQSRTQAALYAARAGLSTWTSLALGNDTEPSPGRAALIHTPLRRGSSIARVTLRVPAFDAVVRWQGGTSLDVGNS